MDLLRFLLINDKYTKQHRIRLQYNYHTKGIQIYVLFSVLCLLCLCDRLFLCALLSPAVKGLTSWLSCAVSNREFVTFQLVS